MSDQQETQKVEEKPQTQPKEEEIPEENEPVEEKKQQQEQIPAQPEKEVKDEDKKQEQKPQDEKQIPMGQIINQISQSEPKPLEIQKPPVQKTIAVPPTIINPVHYYKCNEKYNWRVEQVNSVDFIQKLQTKVLPEIFQIDIPQGMDFSISQTPHIKGHVFYTVRIKDSKGGREITRRFSEFMAFRSKLVELWPCIFLCALPQKTLMGISQEDLISNRSKYIIRFLRSISKHQQLYDSEQVQYFLNESQQKNMQSYFQSIKVPNSMELYQKYKKIFSDEYVYSQRQQFIYRKQKIPELLEQYEIYFSLKKMDLMDSLTSIRRLTESKQNYFKAVNKLNQVILPQYEDILYRWIYGQSLPQSPPSIMQRMSRKSTEEQQIKQNKQSLNYKYGLYSTESYKTKLEDTALLIHDYNNSTHQIYDVLKFQLKEIDTILAAIEQSRTMNRQIEYLRRTMTINKEQIESLNSNKKTLKTFFMDGTQDQKKTRLSNQNNILEEQLQKLTQFYYLIMVLFEKQLQEFHQIRASFYSRSMIKACTDELCITRSIMDFYIFQEQLFAKDRIQRIKILSSSQTEENEQIKQ